MLRKRVAGHNPCRKQEICSTSKELVDDFPRCGDNRGTNLKWGQLEVKPLEINGPQMFVAGQKDGASKGRGFGENMSVVNLGRRDKRCFYQAFGDFRDKQITQGHGMKQSKSPRPMPAKEFAGSPANLDFVSLHRPAKPAPPKPLVVPIANNEADGGEWWTRHRA